jgi:hypothetical protein
MNVTTIARRLQRLEVLSMPVVVVIRDLLRTGEAESYRGAGQVWTRGPGESGQALRDRAVADAGRMSGPIVTLVERKKEPDWSESSGKRLQAHTGDTGRTLVARRGSDQSGTGILLIEE